MFASVGFYVSYYYDIWVECDLAHKAIMVFSVDSCKELKNIWKEIKEHKGLLHCGLKNEHTPVLRWDERHEIPRKIEGEGNQWGDSENAQQNKTVQTEKQRSHQ